MTRKPVLPLDRRNTLASAAMGSGTAVTCEYDPMGRRARKTVDTVTTDFVHDSDHLIAEYDGAGTLLRRYVHGPGTDRPIALVEGTAAGTGFTRTYYHADRLCSVVALTNDTGAETARYAYDAYGIPYLVDPATGAQTQVAAGQPYLFTGRRLNFETGLYYYRARYYSASLGRFLQTDPIGYEDQMNLYAYVGNDPVNNTDPSGMVAAGCAAGAGVGAVAGAGVGAVPGCVAGATINLVGIIGILIIHETIQNNDLYEDVTLYRV